MYVNTYAGITNANAGIIRYLVCLPVCLITLGSSSNGTKDNKETCEQEVHFLVDVLK